MYNKLVLQAEEAQEVGLTKLAGAVFDALPKQADDGHKVFNYEELEHAVYYKIWKAALDVVAYYDFDTLDIQKIDDMLKDTAKQLIKKVETGIGTESQFGPFEDKVLGQK